MTSIATLTLNPALDSATHVERVVPDEKLRCTRPEIEPGAAGSTSRGWWHGSAGAPSRCTRRAVLEASGSLPPGVPDDLYARVVREAPDDCRVVVDTSGAALRTVADAGAYLTTGTQLCRREDTERLYAREPHE